MPPIKIDSESNVVMRHGECPRYADVPCAWLTGSASLALQSFRQSLGHPSLLPSDSRRLEWQFSDPLSTLQNKVRHVTKESQCSAPAVGNEIAIRITEEAFAVALQAPPGIVVDQLEPPAQIRAQVRPP